MADVIDGDVSLDLTAMLNIFDPHFVVHDIRSSGLQGVAIAAESYLNVDCIKVMPSARVTSPDGSALADG
jgi:hypothetical protein